MNDKTIDWSAYDDADIARFIDELSQQQKNRRAQKRKELRKMVEKLLSEERMTLEEVFGKTAKGKRAHKSKRLSDLPVKYRNPHNYTQTWTGVGRKPVWLVEALESGRKLNEFAV